jgi:hypothetical protein
VLAVWQAAREKEARARADAVKIVRVFIANPFLMEVAPSQPPSAAQVPETGTQDGAGADSGGGRSEPAGRKA